MSKPLKATPPPVPVDLSAYRQAILETIRDRDIWTPPRMLRELAAPALAGDLRGPLMSQVLGDLEACRLVSFQEVGGIKGYQITAAGLSRLESRYPPHEIEPVAVGPPPPAAAPVSDLDHWSDDAPAVGAVSNRAASAAAQDGAEAPARASGLESPPTDTFQDPRASVPTPTRQLADKLAAGAARNAADAAILRDLARLCPPRVAAVLERAAARLT